MSIGSAGFARADSGGGRATRGNTVAGLTMEVTSFVGRAGELAAIRSRLAEGARIVTLVGVGGVGKSRIARRAARRLLPVFSGGVYFVDLTRLRHDELLAQAVLDSAGIDAVRGAQDSLDRLIQAVTGKDVLIVLDNCDHLHAGCSEFVAALVRQTAGVAVLATSRSPIRTSGEWLVPVPPLTASESADGDRAAVQLFVDRVQAVRPDFAADGENIEQIISLCRRLDGLPLAIELAARRMRVLSLEQLSQRLEDRFRVLTEAPSDVPERHRSLLAVFDFTYEQCSPGERRLWIQASTFVGGASLEALESVCASEDGESVLDLVDGLMQRSILTRAEGVGGPRITMLESVREYGMRRLEESSVQAAVRDRHRDFFAEYVRVAEQSWFGPNQDVWCAAHRAELPNLRAALESFLADGDNAAAAQMVAAMWPLWLMHGYLHEGRMWCKRVISADVANAKAQWVTGWIELLEGNVDLSTSRLARSLELAQSSDDHQSMAIATGLWGAIEVTTGDLAAGGEAQERALQWNSHTDDKAGRALLLFQLAEVYCVEGRLPEALRLAEESRGLGEPLGERAFTSYAMWVQGLAWYLGGDYDAAEGVTRQAMQTKRQIHDSLGIMLVAELYAWIAVERGDLERAALLLGATSAIWDSVACQLLGFQWLITYRDGALERLRLGLEPDVVETRWQQGISLNEQDVVIEVVGDAPDGEPPYTGASSAPAVANLHADTVPAALDGPELTKRELEVARLLAEGLSNRQLARRLVIGQRTVETHVTNILAKTGLERRGQVAAWLANQG
ncbi:ATP-binding protein [Mycobacterium sp. NPDC051198]